MIKQLIQIELIIFIFSSNEIHKTQFSNLFVCAEQINQIVLNCMMNHYLIALLISIGLGTHVTFSQAQSNINTLNGQPNYAISYTLDFSSIGCNPIDKCALCSQDKCSLCNTGFRINQKNQCVETLQKCKVFGYGDLCQVCHPYFKLVNGVCFDTRCEFSGLFSCLRCYPGYLRTLSGFCVDPNCVTYKNGDCSTCRQNFTYKALGERCLSLNSNNITINTSGEIKIDILPESTLGCSIFNIKAECIQCHKNYILSGIRCLQTNLSCSQYNITTGKCLNCKPQYEFKEGECNFLKPLNCITIVNKQCVQCANQYFLKEGICLLVDSNCKDYDKNTGKCFSCFKDYLLSDQKCKKINVDPSSAVFETKVPVNIPTTRTTESLQISYQYCMLNDPVTKNCRRCYNYFYIADGMCQKISQLCKQYNLQSGNCVKCFTGYRINGTQCVLDATINPRNNCQTFNENTGTCGICETGFFLYRQSVCVEVIPSCREYNLTTGECTACYLGFFLNKGFCDIIATGIIVPFCNKYNSLDPRQCLTCITGFNLEDNRCISWEATCLEFRRDTGRCAKCKNNYVLQQGQCARLASVQVLSKNCVQYYGNGLCRQCAEGYYPINYVCYKQKV